MKDLTRIVVSTDPGFDLAEGFERASSPQEAVSMLQARGFTGATLAGGSILNSSFASAQLINAVVLNVEAVVIGRGIPLFAPEAFDLKLEMEGFSQVNERILQLRYRVQRT